MNVAIPRDLETIALKCLEKEPEKRYESAEALADDARFLKAARSWPGAFNRELRRWAKRNPAVAGLLARCSFR